MEETFPILGEDGKILRHSALRLAIRRLKNSAPAGNIPAVVSLIKIQQRLEQAEQSRDDASVVPDLSCPTAAASAARPSSKPDHAVASKDNSISYLSIPGGPIPRSRQDGAARQLRPDTSAAARTIGFGA